MSGMSDEGFDPEEAAEKYVAAINAATAYIEGGGTYDDPEYDEFGNAVMDLEDKLLYELILDISSQGGPDWLMAAADVLYDEWLVTPEGAAWAVAHPSKVGREG